MLYMAFPVLGQILGIFLIFGLTFWFTQNMQDIAAKYDALNNMSSMITLIVVSVIPGVLILIKAFWDYLVAFVALNSMTEGYLNTGRVYDFISWHATTCFVCLATRKKWLRQKKTSN